MKVGTDAILLSIWCDISNAKTILDVGTGSGIIALLLASRSMAKVDAVELDQKSVKEAENNFQNSPYSNRLTIYQDNFNEFAINTNNKYDIVISNPPFFSNDILPDNPSRKAARHIDELSHDKLCKGVASLLCESGKFCVVFPTDISTMFIEIATNYNLNLIKQQLIYSKPNAIPNRVNMEFRLDDTSKVISEDIIIRDENGEHTNQYKEYVDDYLIKI